ncbi:No apical meristem (NAM) protein [Corchorus olitorius]|uniref:No apical meristem (NAM) protein n=1 Tax=Corchorus olitorius TaxID=93759 RepID=A0A1R3IIF5_9ROSI|nr:No apical meristem (NAM) protein [Corchorus olitorius]
MEIINSDNIVGYRFHPTDKELVDHYLYNKVLERDGLVEAINEVKGLCNKDPWDLPGCSKLESIDQVWYFFSRRKENKRVKRTTENGYWKVTGKPRHVKGKNGTAAKRTLVFYKGRFPNGKGTPWVMHEYIFTSTLLENKEGIFLCKLKNKEERDNTSSSEVFQPSLVADEVTPQSSPMFDPDEILAILEEPDRDEARNFSPALQLLMHEEELPQEFAYWYEFSDGHISNSSELNDESWITYLTDEVYPDERSNKQVVESEDCSLASDGMGMTLPGESRKRSRFENGGQCGAIGNEECQATYEQVANASSMLCEHAGLKKIHAMAMANAPNVTITAVENEPHGRDKMLSVHNDSKEMDAPSVDPAVAVRCVFHIGLVESLDYPPATNFYDPQHQECSEILIEQEEDPKRISKQGKISGKTASLDKAKDVKQQVTAANLPQKENAIMESDMKLKTAKQTNGKTSLQMQWKESAASDEKE